jgi:hypothetical protein
MHEIARIKAGRDVSEKLEGLVQFWAADMHAQVLRRIAGARAKSLEAGDDRVDTPAGPE